MSMLPVDTKEHSIFSSLLVPSLCLSPRLQAETPCWNRPWLPEDWAFCRKTYPLRYPRPNPHSCWSTAAQDQGKLPVPVSTVPINATDNPQVPLFPALSVSVSQLLLSKTHLLDHVPCFQKTTEAVLRSNTRSVTLDTTFTALDKNTKGSFPSLLFSVLWITKIIFSLSLHPPTSKTSKLSAMSTVKNRTVNEATLSQ